MFISGFIFGVSFTILVLPVITRWYFNRRMTKLTEEIFQ